MRNRLGFILTIWFVLVTAGFNHLKADFSLTAGDVAMVILVYLSAIILAVYLLFTFLRNFRKKGTASEFVTSRLLPKVLIVLLILLIVIAFLST